MVPAVAAAVATPSTRREHERETETEHETEQEANGAIQLGLGRVRALLALLGNPHRAFKVVHVAGTNGKGSVCACLAAVLQRAGATVGRFSSPHLVSPNDAVSVQGVPVDSARYGSVARAVGSLNDAHGIHATAFELSTVTALALLGEKGVGVDVAVVEVGMGGRLDATNVFLDEGQVLCSVITSIGMDHTDFLGPTIEDIARHKAGIMKRAGRVLIAAQPDASAQAVLVQHARDLGCDYKVVQPASKMDETPGWGKIQWEDSIVTFPIRLLGDFQYANAALAVSAALFINKDLDRRIQLEHITSGMDQVKWPGRLEWKSVDGINILLDGAHNLQCAQALKHYIKQYKSEHNITNTLWIYGSTAGKDMEGILSCLLEKGDKVIGVTFGAVENMPWVKSAPIERIEEAVRYTGNWDDMFEPSINLKDAINKAKEAVNTKFGSVVLTGSLYLVADLYRQFNLPI